MTSLQIFILSTIQKHGPQSDMALWANTRCESLTAVVIATAKLEEDQFIEKTPTHNKPYRFPLVNDPVTFWQLTEKGRQLVIGAAVLGALQKIAGKNEQQEQEVPRCK